MRLLTIKEEVSFPQRDSDHRYKTKGKWMLDNTSHNNQQKPLITETVTLWAFARMGSYLLSDLRKHEELRLLGNHLHLHLKWWHSLLFLLISGPPITVASLSFWFARSPEDTAPSHSLLSSSTPMPATLLHSSHPQERLSDPSCLSFYISPGHRFVPGLWVRCLLLT